MWSRGGFGMWERLTRQMWEVPGEALASGRITLLNGFSWSMKHGLDESFKLYGLGRGYVNGLVVVMVRAKRL